MSTEIVKTSYQGVYDAATVVLNYFNELKIPEPTDRSANAARLAEGFAEDLLRACSKDRLKELLKSKPEAGPAFGFLLCIVRGKLQGLVQSPDAKPLETDNSWLTAARTVYIEAESYRNRRSFVMSPRHAAFGVKASIRRYKERASLV